MWSPYRHYQMTQRIRRWNHGCLVVTAESVGLMDQWIGAAAQGNKIWEGGRGDEAETICFFRICSDIYVFKEDPFPQLNCFFVEHPCTFMLLPFAKVHFSFLLTVSRDTLMRKVGRMWESDQ